MNDRAIKRWVGLTGILLPILVCLRLLDIPPSLSATWYTEARDVFTGGLTVVGGALGCFQGHDERDRRAALIACWSAFGVAFFPMSPPAAVGWAETQGWLHFICALGFFGALASMCGRLFVLTDQAQPGPAKLRRNLIYRTCATIIVIGVAALAVVAISFDHSPAIFWIEVAMVWAFGLAFTVKAGFFRALNDATTIAPSET